MSQVLLIIMEPSYVITLHHMSFFNEVYIFTYDMMCLEVWIHHFGNLAWVEKILLWISNSPLRWAPSSIFPWRINSPLIWRTQKIPGWMLHVCWVVTHYINSWLHYIIAQMDMFLFLCPITSGWCCCNLRWTSLLLYLSVKCSVSHLWESI